MSLNQTTLLEHLDSEYGHHFLLGQLLTHCLYSFLPFFSCFIHHIGVFLGAFLGPILLIILFNTCIFASAVVIIIRHTLARQKRITSKEKVDLPPKEACKLILLLCGITSLLGLAWILSLFTAVGVDTNRNAAFALQWLFIFFNSLQGFFVFFFFVVLKADARNSWQALLCPCCKSTEPPASQSQEGNTMSEVVKELKVTLRHVSARERIDHIETPEVIFNDQP